MKLWLSARYLWFATYRLDLLEENEPNPVVSIVSDRS
jgi:hypothetical protein